MRIPINMGVKGRVTVTLMNTETGEKQEVKGDNLILNHYMDWAMTQGLGILGTTTFDRCYIGTGDTPPQPDDTTFNGTQLAMSAVSELVEGLIDINRKAKYNKTWEIGAVNFNNALLFIPDENLLVVGSTGSTSPVDGLRLFSVDVNSMEIIEVDNSDFSALSDLDCQAISYEGGYLFVGINEYPWGKLYKKEVDGFRFLFDTPEIGSKPISSSISASGNYLLVTNDRGVTAIKSVLYDIQEQSMIWSDNTGYGHISACFYPDTLDRFFVCAYTHSQGYGINFSYYEIVEGSVNKKNTVTSSTSTSYWARATVFIGKDVIISGNNYYKVILDDEGGGSLYSIRKSTPFESMDGGRALWGNLLLGLNPRESNSLPILYMVSNILYQYSGVGIDIDTSRLDRSFTTIDSASILCIQDDNGNVQLFSIQDVLRDQSYSRQWTFPAGVGTGIVNRIGLQANSITSGSGGNNRHVAQIVLPEPLEKTDLHQLDVIWEIEVENPGVWEGVIPGGSRDGSDLAWRVTINEAQFHSLVSTGYSILANWFGVAGTPNVRIGTSNEESDLIFDRENIRGEEIEYISSTALSVVNPYVPGSLKRTIRLFLEVDQGNGQIGEIVLGGSTSANSLVRITFDPPLDKPPDVGEGANPYRIYLDLEIGWQRGE